MKGVHVLFMLLVIIYRYWCLTRFKYLMMFVSCNSNATCASHGGGTAYYFGTLSSTLYNTNYKIGNVSSFCPASCTRCVTFVKMHASDKLWTRKERQYCDYDRRNISVVICLIFQLWTSHLYVRSYITTTPAHGVYTSQLIRYSKVWSSYHDELPW
jgi:hypothetical protein